MTLRQKVIERVRKQAPVLVEQEAEAVAAEALLAFLALVEEIRFRPEQYAPYGDYQKRAVEIYRTALRDRILEGA